MVLTSNLQIIYIKFNNVAEYLQKKLSMSNEIYVASLCQGTFHSELSLNRKYGQSIQDYIAEEMEFRIDLILKNIILATENKDKSCPLFFTLPEFFWNVKWTALRNKDELYHFEMRQFMDHNHRQKSFRCLTKHGSNTAMRSSETDFSDPGYIASAPYR